jgi:hypothetical protein
VEARRQKNSTHPQRPRARSKSVRRAPPLSLHLDRLLRRHRLGWINGARIARLTLAHPRTGGAHALVFERRREARASQAPIVEIVLVVHRAVVGLLLALLRRVLPADADVVLYAHRVTVPVALFALVCDARLRQQRRGADTRDVPRAVG